MRRHLLVLLALGWGDGELLCQDGPRSPAAPALLFDSAAANRDNSGTLEVRLFSSGFAFASLQMDLQWPEGIAELSVSPGFDLLSGKTISTHVLGPTSRRILIYGLNRNELSEGAIATIGVKLNPGSAAGSYRMSATNAVAADATGHAVALDATEGVLFSEAGTPPVLISAVANAASYSRAAIAPGEIVVVGGSRLAETTDTARVESARTYGTSIAGVRVLFDGIAAPLLYVSAGQIGAVVPYVLDGRNVARVEVESQGTRSNSFYAPVTGASPGIFTIDQSGTGQGAILNQDGTVNGPSNPAPRGSVVAVFATGEGQTQPRGVDGSIAGAAESRKPVLPVAASIAGMAAEVEYAGSAPEAVSGLLQVNARIPAAAPRGAVSIAIAIGGRTSQSGVTVAIQ